jgi:hypothetical protein
MLPFEDRYTRQRRLTEVGHEGQRRLATARLILAPHAGVDVERDYLVRAGVSQIQVDPEGSPPPFPWPEFFEFTAPLCVARGAWCALSRIRTVLGLDSR